MEKSGTGGKKRKEEVAVDVLSPGGKAGREGGEKGARRGKERGREGEMRTNLFPWVLDTMIGKKFECRLRRGKEGGPTSLFLRCSPISQRGGKN